MVAHKTLGMASMGRALCAPLLNSIRMNWVLRDNLSRAPSGQAATTTDHIPNLAPKERHETGSGRVPWPTQSSWCLCVLAVKDYGRVPLP